MSHTPPAFSSPPFLFHAVRGRVLAAVSLMSSLALAACGQGTDPPGGDGGAAGGALTYGPCPEDRRVGGFAVVLRHDEMTTQVTGRLEDGIVPTNVRTVSKQEGDCKLLERRNLFCNPACRSDQTCGTGGACIPFPAGRSVGALTITGLKTPVMVTPNPDTKRYSHSSLPHPGFDEGADIRLATGGGDYPAFTLRGEGVAPLEGKNEDILIEDGKPVTVRWTPPGRVGAARVHIELDIAKHGGGAGLISCDVADTGSYTIPASLMHELIALGVAGFPTVKLDRRSADSTSVAPGCVDFFVSSQVTNDVKIAGLTSCNQDEDCPKGQTCGNDRSCK